LGEDGHMRREEGQIVVEETKVGEHKPDFVCKEFDLFNNPVRNLFFMLAMVVFRGAGSRGRKIKVKAMVHTKKREKIHTRSLARLPWSLLGFLRLPKHRSRRLGTLRPRKYIRSIDAPRPRTQ
jgi:hypothetical protein